jgi:uncharacterized phosphatase
MAGQKHILVYAARHGTTDLNQQDAFRGPIDAPLDKAGFQDAHKLAALFMPIEISVIFHSDKKRTRETAKTVAALKGMEVYANPNLAAWNVGDLGGQPKNEENLELVKWHVEHPDVPLPGGESLNAFKTRIHPLIVDAVDIGLKTGVPPLLVVHSSVIHEIGTMIGGHHEYSLVEPGGVAAIYIQDGELDVEPIFKPRPESGQHRAEIMT